MTVICFSIFWLDVCQDHIPNITTAHIQIQMITIKIINQTAMLSEESTVLLFGRSEGSALGGEVAHTNNF